MGGMPDRNDGGAMVYRKDVQKLDQRLRPHLVQLDII